MKPESHDELDAHSVELLTIAYHGSRAARAFRSLVSIFVGWVGGAAVYAVWTGIGTWGLSQNFGAGDWQFLQLGASEMIVVIVWVGIFSILGWLVGFLPLVLFVRPTASMWRPNRLPLIGAIVGVFVYMALIGWAFAYNGIQQGSYWPNLLSFPLYAASIGGIAGWVYARATARRVARASTEVDLDSDSPPT